MLPVMSAPIPVFSAPIPVTPVPQLCEKPDGKLLKLKHGLLKLNGELLGDNRGWFFAWANAGDFYRVGESQMPFFVSAAASWLSSDHGREHAWRT